MRSVCVLVIGERAEKTLDMIVGGVEMNLQNVEVLVGHNVAVATAGDESRPITPVIDGLILILDRLLDELAEDPDDLQDAQQALVSYARNIIDTRKAYARG